MPSSSQDPVQGTTYHCVSLDSLVGRTSFSDFFKVLMVLADLKSSGQIFCRMSLR